uniref:CUB domain-containing protein n=1 Tax=Plectus sambesii TaxID=2011161 RepID=A0A914WU36_9BILA
MDSEVLVNFEHFDLAPNDVLKVYYGASAIRYVPPDKTCTGNSCGQLKAFQITMHFQSGNFTTNGTYGFSATAQSTPRDYTLVASVLIILFLLAVSVPSCVFVWRNKYYKRITRRLNRHHESTNSPVFYSHESSNIIFPPPPSYEVANSMYPVCTVEDDPPPAYEVAQPDHSRNPHSQPIESVNSVPP